MVVADERSVSVALCTHNGEAFVGAQVASILAQKPAPSELVVGDDASTDGTVAVIERVYSDARAADPALQTRLVVIDRPEALGVVANVEATLAACSGTLIALCDQDDVWPSGRLAALAAAFDGDDELLLVHGDARLIDDTGHPLGMTLLEALEVTAYEVEGLTSGRALPVLLRRNLVTGATVMIRSRLRELAAPFPPDWVHDEWLALIAASTGRVRLLTRSVTDYRQHGGNQIGASKPTMADRWAKLREPRARRAAWLVRRTSVLAERGRSLRVAATVQAELDGKAAHEAARSRLPRFPLFRVPGVLAGVVEGRYRRYSRGAVDVLRDLVQPVGMTDPGPDSSEALQFMSGRI